MSEDKTPFADSPFADRFNLLIESNQVQMQVLEVVMSLIRITEEELDIQLTEENAEVFVTHLALALQRVVNDEAIKDAPSALMNEAKSLTKHWERAGKLVNLASTSLDKEIAESEQAYLTVHLANLAISAGE